MAKPERSLLERAADIYDFQSGLPLRPDADPLPPPRRRPVMSAAPATAPVRAVEPAPPPPAPEPVATARRPVSRAPVRHKQVELDTDALAKAGLLVGEDGQGLIAEEFRLVKRRLLAAIDAEEAAGIANARIVLVASGQPGDGKTFTAANLALSLAAEQERHVLLIDGDTAKPDLTRRLGVTADAGFVHSLAEGLDVETLVLDTDVARLSYLPGGRHDRNLPELLASARTGDMFAQLLEADPRRIIIIDSAPALAASVAGVLAGYAGQTLIVVRADRTDEAGLKETIDLLSTCRNLSLVLNGTAFQTGGRRFGKYEDYR